MRLCVKVFGIAGLAILFTGCFGDGVETCDNASVKETTKEILLKNGVQGVIENQAIQSVEDEKVYALVAKEVKAARFGLLEAKIQNIIEDENDGIYEKNEKIKADNRYSEIKKPLNPLVDGSPIIQDLEKYKSMIDAFEPINSSDSFAKFFEAKILLQRPLPLFVSYMAEHPCSWGTDGCKNDEWKAMNSFKSYHLSSSAKDLKVVEDFIRQKRNEIIKELSKKEVEKITKTLDIVNIRELSVDKKAKMRQCEASVKLNDNVSNKIFKYSIRHQDDGRYLIQVNFR